ncbi:molybdate ABC transporter substrate-binding protein [Pasteurella skyensis]|uniref:Molybdate ABC transporter substrate-binding protein n=1 Tax=Phocoenobacter skyensis TaxID=97481 RepID=A0AAJ6NB48_9PAST|nr:molybdate ABC transporter substrate-binding protein [Pasteurella skyensis]MDP8163330.1 molybdate ABC transporter substrate-binding protein [Pasteurella skyensis]MDP8173531.1 molybdate ABC transporter substrate-binding protein [Pasteurella skyensis]MDP8177240.1 molybdate ABC transporter substrate-binding protein [Pasteurella skyensis]MDP8179740.1 molybdate ABC transporter substrate-binding protein [Pasteurella skyensis]MDP8183854.1 molybdate ABC transporter substrate-binding protein [Pasteur
MNLKKIVYLLLFFTTNCFADINIAVASNFVPTMQKIVKSYTNVTATEINILSGSSGKHYAQIQYGAPIDLFFSADQKRPNKLLKQQKAIRTFTYAIGRLVYWKPQYNSEKTTFEEAVKQKSNHLALANPKYAPYGIAAKETLELLGLWKIKQPLYIFGENIAQTYHFVTSRGSDAGFVAYSQVKQNKQIQENNVWLVPQRYHSLIKQDVAIIHDNEEVQQFLRYFHSKEVQNLILTDGYSLND